MRGVAVCGSGVGAAVCANKIAGVRAALIEDHFSARQGVEDDHMNIICLGGRIVGPELAWDLVEAFLAAEFSQSRAPFAALGQSCRAGTLSIAERPMPGAKMNAVLSEGSGSGCLKAFSAR